jgi:hypothetical protein
MPSLTTTGDTNTGIWFPAADTLAASTDGTERMRIDSSGNVGIGTSSPAAKLDVTGTSRVRFDTAAAYAIEYITNAAISAYAPKISVAADHQWQISGVEKMRLDSAGNVGIGTTSPAATLDVSGSFSVAKANALNQILTDAATISWDGSLGQIASITLTDGVGATRTFGAPTNLRVGTYILYVTQGGTGSKDITWNSVFKWTQGVKPVLSTVAGRVDIFSFISDGTNLYGVMIPDVR